MAPRFRCRQMHSGSRVHARMASLMSCVAVQLSRKADYKKRRSYFSIFVSLLRVMHAGQPSNLSTLLQSQTKSGPCARLFTVCVCTVEVHLSAQGFVQYLCSAKRTMKVPGLHRRVHVHSHMYGCCTNKCYSCT